VLFGHLLRAVYALLWQVQPAFLTEASQPSAVQLHSFMDPKSKSWPLGRLQNKDEAWEDFWKRYVWKAEATRIVAIVLTVVSAAFFAFGVYQVLRAANSVAVYSLPY
jgi:hypothetical protein